MILLQGHPGRGGLLGVGGEQGGPCRVCVEPGPPEGQRARSHRTRVYGCEVATFPRVLDGMSHLGVMYM